MSWEGSEFHLSTERIHDFRPLNPAKKHSPFESSAD